MAPDPYSQYWNPYLSMGNNPINSIDPDGGMDTNPPDNGVGLSFNPSPNKGLISLMNEFNNNDRSPGTFFMQVDARLSAPIPGLKLFKEIPIGLTGGSAAGLAIDGNSIALFASLSFGVSGGVGFTSGFSGGFFPSATVDELIGGGFSAGAWAQIGDLVSLVFLLMFPF